MAIDSAAVLAHHFAPVRQPYGERDAILYALGLGAGVEELDLVYEAQLKVLPTFAVTLASPGLWVREPALGIDWVRLVHSAQAATFNAPLPARGEVIGEARVASLTDRGEAKGAVLVVERKIRDAATSLLLCTVKQTLLLRGDGGFGGEPPPRVAQEMPERAPDLRYNLRVSPRAALIYRLSGDWNPLHIDPAVAAGAGFDRPILHGLASYGMAGLALCRALGADPRQLRSLSVRFAGIVHPGDTLDFSLWREGDDVRFVADADGRRVLDHGNAELGDEA